MDDVKRMMMAVGMLVLATTAHAGRMHTIRTPVLTQAPGGWMNCYVGASSETRRPAVTVRMTQAGTDVSEYTTGTAVDVAGTWYVEARTGTVATGASRCVARVDVRDAHVELVAFDADGYVVGQVFGE